MCNQGITLNKENKYKIRINIEEVSMYQCREEVDKEKQQEVGEKETNEMKEYKLLQILAIMKYKIDQINKEIDDLEINTLRFLEEIACRQIDQEKIKGVLNTLESNPKKRIIGDLTICYTQLSLAKTHSSKVTIIEVYLMVFTTIQIKKFVKDDIEMLK